MEINIAHFYPDLLNLYGDAGNVSALSKRLEWRNIKVNVSVINEGDIPDFSNIDIAIFGGGSDKEQKICVEEMRKFLPELKTYIEDGGVFLALCGGFTAMGKYYETESGREDGLGILDIKTEKSSKRYISNVVIETESGKVAGFENHFGKTYIDGYEPIGKVLYGNGNNGEDKTEGARYKNLYGTNLHGPLLPKNPVLCDEILFNAVKRKYPEQEAFSPLDDTIENEALEAVVRRFIKD